MLSDLRLLIMENSSHRFICDNISQIDRERVMRWYPAPLEDAVSELLWCHAEGSAAFGLQSEANVFYKRAAQTGISTDRLYSLYDTHRTLYEYPDGKGDERITGRGRLIVLEGLDGAGKTTHLEKLRKSLTAAGRTVYATAEPTSSSTGGIIRDTLAGFMNKSSSELAALFLADRIAHNVNPINGISKFISEGCDVICDRYYYSSFAYQGIDSDLSWVIECNKGCPQIMKPDLCIFLDLDAEICAKRIASGRLTFDIFETEETIRKIKRRFVDVFRKLNATDNIKIVNTNRQTDAVAAEIYDLTTAV